MKRSKPKPKKVGQTTIKLETLRPLPVRITQRQYLRLVAHREIDQLAIQEHVRRALDLYLDDLDWRRAFQLTDATPGQPPSVMSRPHQEPTQNPGEVADENTGAEPTGVQSKKPKLVYR